MKKREEEGRGGKKERKQKKGREAKIQRATCPRYRSIMQLLLSIQEKLGDLETSTMPKESLN